jgi:uncharacterized coiled-coil protein SlyX
MEEVVINNPVFNDQLASQMVSTGNVEIAVALVLLQIVIIPFALMIFKNWQAGQKKQIEELQAAHKRIIDLEAEKRTMQRDDQFKTFDNRLSHLEKDNNQKIDEMSKNVDRMNNTMIRLFEKFDKLSGKMEEVMIRLVKVEK